MKVVMMVDSFELKQNKVYDSPDYELIFYDYDGSEVSLGLSKEMVKHIEASVIVCGEQR